MRYRRGPRHARPVDAGCIERGTNGEIRCLHVGTNHAANGGRCEFYKPIAPPRSRAAIRDLVYATVGARWDGGPDLRPLLVEYIYRSGGECVLHAAAALGGNLSRCTCAACDPKDPRKPWRELDAALGAEAALIAQIVAEGVS